MRVELCPNQFWAPGISGPNGGKGPNDNGN